MRAHCRLSCAVVARLAECSLRALLRYAAEESRSAAAAVAQAQAAS